MANIQIRHHISYQVDYLDLKGLNKDSEKILKELANIQSLTNTTESSHLSLLIIPRVGINDYNLNRERASYKELFHSLVGVPYLAYKEGRVISGSRKTIDISILKKETQERMTCKNATYMEVSNTPIMAFGMKRKQNLPQPEKVIQDRDIIGVVFMHTLLYKKEVSLLCRMLQSNSQSKNFDDILKGYFASEQDPVDKGITTVIQGDYNSTIRLSSQADIEKLYSSMDYKPMAFSIMIPVYKTCDFLEPATSIYTKQYNFKENTILNWYVPSELRRWFHPTVDPFTNKETIDSVVINFTYFPSSLNTKYYNKYVEGMVSNSSSNFEKLPVLTEAFTVIKNSTKAQWSILNSLFAFNVVENNLISTININRYAGSLGNNTHAKNSYDYITIAGNATVSKLHLLTSIIGGFRFSENVKNLITEDRDLTVDEFKLLIGNFENGVDTINILCEKNKISPIITKELRESLLSYLYYYFLTDIMERFMESKYKHTRNVQLSFAKPSVQSLRTTSYSRDILTETLKYISILVKTHTTDEIIDILVKSKELYVSYIKDSFISFLRIDKTFKAIVESHQHNNPTVYMKECLCDVFGGDYREITINFFSNQRFGHIIQMGRPNMANMERKFGDFFISMTSAKFKTKDKTTKRPEEFQLFDILLYLYRNTPIKYHQFGKEQTCIYDWFGTKEYKKILDAKLPFNEHIQRITTFLETITLFNRII